MTIGELKKDVDLFAYNTLRVKAVAQYFHAAKTREELIAITKLAHDQGLALYVWGGGSNLAVTKRYIEGIVVKNLYMKREVLKDEGEYVEVSVSSGYPVTKLINELTEEGLEGLEHHLGLPGTVGGAIYMNSKWTHPLTYFGDPLVEAVLLTPDGHEKRVSRDYFRFAYDYSILHETKEIVLEAVFRFKKEDPALLTQRAQEAHAYRKRTQPEGVATSGCFFQNITPEEAKKIGVDTQSAGNLIDKSGLKGYRRGAFIVSPTHANFVINEGDGTPEDLTQLLRHMKSAVHDTFNITLREEVVVI